ncbi:MAG: hypothetical protein M5R36_18150 [Deltaproteobacteria bacterium]|nr:hypothetical protein [Deltaproteobacteria bacterium]
MKDEEHILSINFHHSVMDPAKAYIVITTMLARYHEKIKGEKPEWAKALGMAMLKRKEGFIKPLPMRTFAREQLSDTLIKNTNSRVATIRTRRLLDPAEHKGRISLRAVIDDEKILDGLLARALRNHATLNDLIFACAHRVIRAWNDERGETKDRFRFMLITSLTGRMALGDNTGAGLSGLNFYFGSPGEHGPGHDHSALRERA